MNIKALITTVALIGSSSVAMARPAFTATAEASWSFNYGSDRPVVRDHRTAPASYAQPGRYTQQLHVQEPMMFPDNNALADDASVYKGPLPTAGIRRHNTSGYGYQSRAWLAITAPTRIDRGRQFVTDLPDLGRLNTVRLQNVTGSTKVEHVLIRFKDGGEQIVTVGRTLNKWNSTIDIRVDGGARKIHGFVINGQSAYGSAYQILAL